MVCVCSTPCHTLHFREHTGLVEFIAFLIHKLEAIVQKKSHCFGELKYLQRCKGECCVTGVHDTGIYCCLAAFALISHTTFMTACL